MADEHPDPRLDLIAPARVVDSRGFLVGLWVAESMLVGAGLSGLVLQRIIGPTFNVVTALAVVSLFVPTYAIVERGKLRPRPSALLRLAAVVITVVAVVSLGAFVVVAVLPGPRRIDDPGMLVLLLVAATAVIMGWLVVAFRARMFRWLRA